MDSPDRLWADLESSGCGPVFAPKPSRQCDRVPRGFTPTLMDGLWLFTSWSTGSLAQKSEALAEFVRNALIDLAGLDGAVISSGPAMAQGLFCGESARLSNGAVAMRRVLPCMRVRETIIVPIEPSASATVTDLVCLYDCEPDWLGWALAAVGLGAVHEVVATRDRCE